LTVETAKDALSLFNERVSKIDGSRFIQILRAGNAKARVWTDAEGVVHGERTGPDWEAIENATTTLRAFVHDGDGISFGCLAEIYETFVKDEALLEGFRGARAAVQKTMASYVPFEFNFTKLTLKELLESFQYGEVIHVEQSKRKTFQRLMSFGPFTALYEGTLVSVLIFLYEAALAVREMNHAALRLLDKGPK
jgi:hypothetical protein